VVQDETHGFCPLGETLENGRGFVESPSTILRTLIVISPGDFNFFRDFFTFPRGKLQLWRVIRLMTGFRKPEDIIETIFRLKAAVPLRSLYRKASGEIALRLAAGVRQGCQSKVWEKASGMSWPFPPANLAGRLTLPSQNS
jgi:hypothetical protein